MSAPEHRNVKVLSKIERSKLAGMIFPPARQFLSLEEVNAPLKQHAPRVWELNTLRYTIEWSCAS